MSVNWGACENDDRETPKDLRKEQYSSWSDKFRLDEKDEYVTFRRRVVSDMFESPFES